jgi:hypothetical protein
VRFGAWLSHERGIGFSRVGSGRTSAAVCEGARGSGGHVRPEFGADKGSGHVLQKMKSGSLLTAVSGTDTDGR